MHRRVRQDRPHHRMGRSRQTPTIEILSFDGCPNHQPLLEHLTRLLRTEGITAPIAVRSIEDDDQARRERFLGSPTLRVDGRDVEPGAAERTDYGLKCRIYQTAAGLAGMPPDEWILAALPPE